MDRRIRRALVIVALALGVAPALAACAPSSDATSTGGEDEPFTKVTDREIAAAAEGDISGLSFENLTPVGEKLMHASHYWMGVQDNYPQYPRPRMCASNVSKVFFLAGITRYDQEGVRDLIDDVTTKGGDVRKMPQNKAQFIAKLNAIHGGHIPAGTVIAGMNIHTSKPGDQHIGFIGHTDEDGILWTYHNNWYRPANEGGQRKPYMVSDENLHRGFERQWMAVPWLKITRNEAGAVVDVVDLIPAIDDMNPFNPDYQVTLAIPAEIASALQ